MRKRNAILSIALIGSLTCLLGCTPSVPVMSEQRSIAYEDASLSRSHVEFERNGVKEKKMYFSIDWNLRPGNRQSSLEALNTCLAAIRAEDKSGLAKGAGVQELKADYVAILIYRAREKEIGEYELGLVIRLEDLFSTMNGNELIEIGKRTDTPVLVKNNGWDFSWAEDQIADLYRENHE